MQTVANSKPKSNPQQNCSCPVHRAIDQARETLREIGFDPHETRGLFFAELSVVFARLGSGLPPLRSSLESLCTVADSTRTEAKATPVLEAGRGWKDCPLVTGFTLPDSAVRP
jgi:hypothetical protein